MFNLLPNNLSLNYCSTCGAPLGLGSYQSPSITTWVTVDGTSGTYNTPVEAPKPSVKMGDNNITVGDVDIQLSNCRVVGVECHGSKVTISVKAND